MFYAHFVLSKKGPLARIWLAAHWDKKLTRSQVFETNITSSVEAILEPKVKLALRTSGHLLLGVVRIHSRQAKYLLSDCNEAFVKIKMAFRPGAELADSDQHRDNSALAAITLSDNIHDFESTLADINDLDPFGIAVNQSRPEDITMREEFGEPNLGRPDDDFGDSTFEDAAERDFVGDAMGLEAGRGGGVSGGELAGDMGMEEDEAELALTEELARGRGGLEDEDALDHRGRALHDDSRDPSDARADAYPEMPSSVGLGNNDSEFGDVMDCDYGDSESVENLETMFQDSTATGGARAIGDAADASDSGPIDSRLIMDSSCATSVTVTGAGISMATSGAAGDLHAVLEDDEMSVVGGEAGRLSDRDQEFIDILDYSAGADNTLVPHAPAPAVAAAPDKKHAHPAAADRFTIPTGNNNSNESATAAAAAANNNNNNQPGRINLPEFVLPPIDRTREPRRAPKRKRKLLIDEHKSIPSDVMKLQMQDTSEITTRLDLAPPTRKLMLWKETGNVEALFTNPGRAIPSRILQKLFYRNMKTLPVPNDSPDGLPPIPAAARARRAPNGGFLILDVEDDSPPPPPAPAPIPIAIPIPIAMAGSIVANAAASDGPAIIDQSDSAAAGKPVGLNLSLDNHDPGADSGAGHDLCNISEVTELPDGACSSYSTNYDCWSGGHPTPHRPDDDDDRDLACHVPAGMGASPGLTTGAGLEEHAKSPSAGSPPGRQDSLGVAMATSVADLSHMSIEKARGAGAASAGALDASSRDDAPSFVLPGGLGGGSLSLSLSQSLISSSATDPAAAAADADKTLTSIAWDTSAGSGELGHDSPGGVDGLGIGIGIDIGADAGANQLQNTMVMLDQQLDKVNEEYPVEITPEGLEKRSDIMLSVLRSAIRREGQVDFHHLTVSNNKKQAASKFYTLLLLGKQRRLQMVQETPYSNIIITRVDAGPSE